MIHLDDETYKTGWRVKISEGVSRKRNKRRRERRSRRITHIIRMKKPIRKQRLSPNKIDEREKNKTIRKRIK